ncbi:Hypothetical predicted protein [Mytilus galloprovincialis]|uniref:Uncharacterized protein n=1 Tax=Mytilus galloprovincialis TaxID=29158 RepID=A0A8B6H8I5_MYTGA|nr:Hypothetical predicted protein [Mytilus galloprovincialis]
MKSKYLHESCFDWRELGVRNKDIEVHAKGSVSSFQKTDYAVKIIDRLNQDKETLAEACDKEYRDIKPASVIDDIHFVAQAVQNVSTRKSTNPTNVQFLNQIAMHKIKCIPGDSGMCIYVRNPADGKLWCIGMAIASDPSGGCIITPLKAILKHFNYKC